MGYGPFTAAYGIVSQFLYFRIIKTIFFSLCYLLDKMLQYLKPKNDNFNDFAIGYFIILEKEGKRI